MDKKFKKIIKILENLKKIDGRISEDNLFRGVDFECDFINEAGLKKILKKLT